MRSESAESVFSRNQRVHHSDMPGRRGLRPPSASGYIVVSGTIALILFFVVWGVLHGASDEAPWAAALTACVALLIAASAREIIIRRAWARQLLEADGRVRTDSYGGRSSHIPLANSAPRHSSTGSPSRSGWSHTTAFRTLQRRANEADAADLPEAHWEVYQLCREYLETTGETLRSNNLLPEKRLAMRAGVERGRALRKHHLMAWARGKTAGALQEARQRARLYDKIDTANGAFEVLETALAEYPEESELHNSLNAVREFMASSRIAHWVEIAERAAFRGHYRRALARYHDALFYVLRETMDPDTREELAARLQHEIKLLREQIANAQARDEATNPPSPSSSSVN